MRGMKIDVHCHAYPVEYLNEVKRLAGKDTENALAGGIPVPVWDSAESRLAKMDEQGLDLQVLSLTMPPPIFGEEADLRLAQITNDSMAAVCHKYPTRFKAFANIPLSNPSYAIKELDRAINDLGLIGITVGTYINSIPITSSEYLPIFEELNRMKLPIHIHPMMSTENEVMREYHLAAFLGFLFETTIAATRLVFGGVFEKFPNINLILSHFGGTIPFVLPRLDDGYKGFREIRKNIPKLPSDYFKRFYYDTATSFTKSTFMCTYDLVGAEQIVFGTDDPFARSRLIERKIADLEALGLPAEEMDKIYSGNAQRFLKL
jgi:aminocarboxymuconate-semialdehyde decarboxylase